MTDSRNVEGRISLWMEQEEAGTHFPDRLLSATFEETRELRQARSLRWRNVPMLRSLPSWSAAGAAAVAVLAVGVIGLNLVASPPDPTGSPSPDATEAPSPATQESEPVATPFGPRRGGEILMFRWGPNPGWDLDARDPETDKFRKVVETNGILDCAAIGSCVNFVKTATWSPDGRWVAFDVSFGSFDGLPHGPCGPTAGLWVQGTIGGPRQLTTPCEATPGAERINELWAWSPDSTRLAVARLDGDDDRLFLIDPSDGSRTLLTEGGGVPTGPGWAEDGTRRDPMGLGWAPDGTRLAYAVGGSVYEVRVDSGERSLLAESFDDVEDVKYSPDGKQIALLEGPRIQVMNADGSDLHSVFEGDADSIEWSPNSDRILYQLSVQNGTDYWDSEVWTVAPDGTNRIKVFDSDGCNMWSSGQIGDAVPVWAPNGTQVAYAACGRWLVSNADGTGEPQLINERVHRSLAGGRLSGWDLPGLFN